MPRGSDSQKFIDSDSEDEESLESRDYRCLEEYAAELLRIGVIDLAALQANPKVEWERQMGIMLHNYADRTFENPQMKEEYRKLKSQISLTDE